MKRFVIPAIAFALLAAAGAIAYPPATLTQTDSSITVSSLDCATQYEIRVREWRSGAWRDTNTYYTTTTACPTPTPTPTATPTATPVPAPAADFSIDPNPAVRTQTTTFTSTGTCDATPCEYHWFHGDASSTDEIDTAAVQPNLDATFVYTGPVGTRTITLKVTDAQARTSSKTITFNLVEPSTPPTPTPTATATPPPGDYPDADNTGVPAGTTLTAYTGPSTITTAGTEINGKTITSPLTINAANVTVRNSRISTGTSFGIVNNSTGFLIEDSEIVGSDGTGLLWDNYTARRVEVSGFENGCQAGDNVTLEDSWIHDLDTSNDAHTDGCQFSPGAGNILIRHNTIEPQTSGTPATTSAIIMHTGGDPQNHDVRIENNRLDGSHASVSLYCPRASASNIFIVDNRMRRGVYGFYTDACTIGHVTQFSGNVDDLTGAPIPVGG